MNQNIICPVGTITADGRLDLCKQKLGVAGINLVCEALKHHTGICWPARMLSATPGPGVLRLTVV